MLECMKSSPSTKWHKPLIYLFMSVNSIEESSTSSMTLLLFMKEPRPHSNIEKCKTKLKLFPCCTIHHSTTCSLIDPPVDSTNHTFQPCKFKMYNDDASCPKHRRWSLVLITVVSDVSSIACLWFCEMMVHAWIHGFINSESYKTKVPGFYPSFSFQSEISLYKPYRARAISPTLSSSSISSFFALLVVSECVLVHFLCCHGCICWPSCGGSSNRWCGRHVCPLSQHVCVLRFQTCHKRMWH